MVTNMFAKDLDAGENGSVTFSLVSGQLAAGWQASPVPFRDADVLCGPAEADGANPHFEIDGETGDIRTTEHFAQNSRPVYTLNVRATDGGAPPLEDSAVVHVQVCSLPPSVSSR